MVQNLKFKHGYYQFYSPTVHYCLKLNIETLLYANKQMFFITN